jgi:L-fuculose-phosphate aldolase
MKKIRDAMVGYAARFYDLGFCSENSCFAVKLNERSFMLCSLPCDRKITSDDVVIVVMDDFCASGKLHDLAAFFYDLFLYRKDVWTAGIFNSNYSDKVREEGKTIPPILDDMCQILATKIVCAKGLNISDVLDAMRGGNACHVNGVGMLVAERSLDELLTAAQALEKSAKTYLLAKRIGGAKHISKFRAWAEHIVFKNVYSVQNQKLQRASEGINDLFDAKFAATKSRDTDFEGEKRALIVDTLKKLSNDNLVLGTWGNVSLRIDDKLMLCSPKGIGYNILRPQDIAVVNIQTLENKGGITASSEKGIHAGILKRFPHINAVIHAHPVYAGIFSAAHKDLTVESEDDRKLLGGVVRSTVYASPSTRALTKQTLRALDGNRAAFMANHGIVVCGENIEQAYAALVRLEELCKEAIGE